MRALKTAAATLSVVLMASCSGLSDEARGMVGDYYIPELSSDEPIMELNDDGSCVVHAIKKDVLSYSVKGEWNVLNDSLIMELDPATLAWEGDSALIGDIPVRMAKRVTDFNGLSLTLTVGGVDYVYFRHVDAKE